MVANACSVGVKLLILRKWSFGTHATTNSALAGEKIFELSFKRKSPKNCGGAGLALASATLVLIVKVDA
eukprot:3759651-Alexandrium_andersonii.AAC.1